MALGAVATVSAFAITAGALGVSSGDGSPTPPGPGQAPAGDSGPLPARAVTLPGPGGGIGLPPGVSSAGLVRVPELQVVARAVNGRSYPVGPGTAAGTACFVEVDDAGGDAVMGCDPPSELEAKGGWAIWHPDGAGTRAGLVILPPGRSAVSAAVGSGRVTLASGRAVVFSSVSFAAQEVRVQTAQGPLRAVLPAVAVP